MRGTIIEERMDDTKTRPRLLLDWMVKEGCSMVNEKVAQRDEWRYWNLEIE